jgi:hypothetical protein
MPNLRPRLIEPTMKVEVAVSQKHMGDVIGDLNSRHGQVTGMQPHDGLQLITAFVPTANLFGYTNTLHHMTQSRARYRITFSHYQPVPPNPPDGDDTFRPPSACAPDAAARRLAPCRGTFHNRPIDGRRTLSRGAILGRIPDFIRHPQLRELFDYWRTLAPGGSIPLRRAIDPLALRSMLPHLQILEIGATPEELRYRLAGGVIVDAFGFEPTGLTRREIRQARVTPDR